jgi:hypothetical protein
VARERGRASAAHLGFSFIHGSKDFSAGAKFGAKLLNVFSSNIKLQGVDSKHVVSDAEGASARACRATSHATQSNACTTRIRSSA